jgi:hydrogenase maturation protease
MILIIGYGNPLRGDDGVGWHAAELLSEENLGDAVEVLACHQLVPELAEHLSRVELAIFIDASATTPVGSVEFAPVSPSSAPPGAMAHHVTPGALLGMADSLFGGHCRGYMISIGCESFGYSTELSSEIAAVFPQVQHLVRDIIRQNADLLPHLSQ